MPTVNAQQAQQGYNLAVSDLQAAANGITQADSSAAAILKAAKTGRVVPAASKVAFAAAQRNMVLARAKYQKQLHIAAMLKVIADTRTAADNALSAGNARVAAQQAAAADKMATALANLGQVKLRLPALPGRLNGLGDADLFDPNSPLFNTDVSATPPDQTDDFTVGEADPNAGGAVQDMERRLGGTASSVSWNAGQVSSSTSNAINSSSGGSDWASTLTSLFNTATKAIGAAVPPPNTGVVPHDPTKRLSFSSLSSNKMVLGVGALALFGIGAAILYSRREESPRTIVVSAPAAA